MIALRCNGNKERCNKLLAYKKDNNVIEYKNHDGVKILILGTAIFRCRCGHLTIVNPIDGVFSDEIRKASVTYAGISG